LAVKKQWLNEETYLAFIHTILYEMSMKAALYYHLCCVGLGITAETPPQPPSELQLELNDIKRPSPNIDQEFGSLQYGRKTREKAQRSFSDSHITHKIIPSSSSVDSKESFFRKMNFDTSDIEIVENLAEIIKEQQCTQIHGVDKFVPVIRLDYSQMANFKNIKKP